MSTNSLTRIVIESAITRGIYDIQSDPKRGVRKLTDLGKHFSKNRIHDGIFSIIQDILQNEDTPYYEAVHNLIEATDINILKKFGMNFGYNSLTFGARKISENEQALGYKIPWIIVFNWDPRLSSGLNLQHISNIVRQGKELGIYSYCINQKSYAAGWENIASLFDDNQDCAFFWYFNTDVALDHNFLSPISNVMILLNQNKQTTAQCTEKLKELNAMYGIVKEYSAVEDVTCQDLTSTATYEHYGTPFVFFLADDNCSEDVKNEVGDIVLNTRLNPKVPIFFLDFYSDIKRIDKLVSIHSGVIQIDYDTTLRDPKNSNISVLDKNMSLKNILSDCMR